MIEATVKNVVWKDYVIQLEAYDFQILRLSSLAHPSSKSFCSSSGGTINKEFRKVLWYYPLSIAGFVYPAMAELSLLTETFLYNE